MAFTNFSALTSRQKKLWSASIWQTARKQAFVNYFGGKKVGCDIHMVLERKSGPAKWIGIERFNSFPTIAVQRFGEIAEHLKRLNWMGWTITSRNYHLFATLAGVRSDELNRPAVPRGIPEDVSELAQAEIEAYEADGHSHSWGLLSEIGGHFLAHYCPEMILDADRANTIHRLFNTNCEDEPLEHFRLVYWFDN